MLQTKLKLVPFCVDLSTISLSLCVEIVIAQIAKFIFHVKKRKCVENEFVPCI